jgi:predicted kinase
MPEPVKGSWNIVLSGYPKSGKTLLARRIVAENSCFARVGVDELREMLFNEVPPCRDEYLLYSVIAETRDALLRRGYSVVTDSTAPDDITRQFLLTTKIRRLNQLLIVLTVDREILARRNIVSFGDASSISVWDKRWQEPKRECCLFKFRSNNMEEFDESYARLEELLESETHPFRPEYRLSLPPGQEIRKALREFLRKHSYIIAHV